MVKHSLKDWVIATRPWSFPASLMPVLVTIAYLYWMGVEINMAYGFCALVGMLLFQAGGNTWSDYYDYKKGVDAVDTFGAKILTDGLFAPKEIRRLGFVLLSVAVVLGLWLVIRTGLPLLWIGLAGLVCALFYPFFKYHAWGDMLIFIAYAVLPAIGTSYVTTGMMRWETIWVVVPVGLITVAILHVNNMRDIKTDTRARISTLAMKIGQKLSVALYTAELLVPFLWVLVCIVMEYYPLWTLICYLVLPVSLKNVRTAWSFPKKGYEVILKLDERTAQLQLLFSMIFSLSFFIGKLVG